LVYLKSLTTIESLDLSSTQVSDTGLEYLKGMTSLRALYLSGTQVTERVNVTLTEGKMTLDKETVPPCNRAVFHVKNTGKEQHHFVVAVTGFPPDKMPVKNGRVRYFTYVDEPHRLTFRDGGGWSEQSARGHEPQWGPHRKEPGVKIAPGEEVEFKETHMYDPRFKPGTSFVLFCNEPGHYEQGEYAQIVVK
jgi:uncharacterized cupredoxin-like copper-binding protein